MSAEHVKPGKPVDVEDSKFAPPTTAEGCFEEMKLVNQYIKDVSRALLNFNNNMILGRQHLPQERVHLPQHFLRPLRPPPSLRC